MRLEVRVALSQPMEIDGQWYQSSASIGVALALGGRESAHDLMREHLEHIEHSLDLHTTPTSALDLESIFKRA